MGRKEAKSLYQKHVSRFTIPYILTLHILNTVTHIAPKPKQKLNLNIISSDIVAIMLASSLRPVHRKKNELKLFKTLVKNFFWTAFFDGAW